MISKQLEADIRNEIFKTKLPSVRQLSAQFDVSTRTINKAIKTLTSMGLVVPAGTRGVFINQQTHIRPKTGNVMVFCNRETSELEHDILLDELKRVIQEDGACPLFMNTPQMEIFKDETFWKSGWVDGYIFIYSSFDRQFAHQLKRNHIPFVVANMVPDEFGVNWIDFDNDATHRKIMGSLVEKGFQRIGYCALMNDPESHQQSIAKLFNPMKRKYSLDLNYFVMHNEANFLTKEDTRKFAREVALEMLKLESPPEALFTLFSPSILKEELDRVGLDDVYIVAAVTSNEYENEKNFPCAVSSYSRLAQETFKRFKEVCDNPNDTVQQIRLESKYFLSNKEELILEKAY
jgi:DNA-binding LacI/PurR family transcriptional regulator